MSIEYGSVNLYSKYSQPSLDLVFTGPKKSLTDRSSNVTVEFTRTQDTPSSYVKSDGTIGYASTDVARFDHDPVTGESLGLLIEESRTNYCRESAEVTNLNGSSPAVNGVRTVVSALLPDGTTGNCAQLYTNVVQDNYYIGAQGMPADTGFSASWWVKNTSGFEISFEYGRGSRTKITLPNDNKWHKIQFYAGTSNSIGQWYNLSLFDSRSSTTTNPSVTPITVLMWGLQVEAGSFPTSYIPTSGSTSTRGADTAIITGTNFSSWWNSSEGTLVSVATAFGTSGLLGVYEFNDGTSTPSGPVLLALYNSNTFMQSPVNGNYTGSTIQFSPSNIPKVAFAFATGDIAASAGGQGTKTNISGLDPNVVRVFIGAQRGPVNYLNGHISRLTYWPTRLPDSDLQRLTE